MLATTTSIAATYPHAFTLTSLPGATPRRRRTWHPRSTKSRRSHLSRAFASSGSDLDSDDSDHDDDDDHNMMVDSHVPSPAEHFGRFDVDFAYDANTRPSAPGTPSAKQSSGSQSSSRAQLMAPLSALRRTMHDSLTLNSPSRSPSVRKGLAHGGGAAGSRRTSSSIETMRPLIFKKQQSLPTILPSSSKLLNLIVYQDDLEKENTSPSAPPPSPNHPFRHLATRPPLANISSMYPSAGISHAHLAALFSCPPLEPANTLTNPVVRRSAKSTTQLRNEYVHAIPATSRTTLHRSDTFPLGHAAQCTGGGSRRSLPAYMPMTAQERSRTIAVDDVLDADQYFTPVPLTAVEDPLQRADFEVDLSDMSLVPVQTREMVLSDMQSVDDVVAQES